MKINFENKLKKNLKKGHSTVGAWLHLCSPIAAEVLSCAEFDWLLIDMEHGYGDYQTLLTQLQAMQGGDATPLVRVQGNEHAIIKRVLDMGAHGVMIPNISDAQEAEMAVKACKYPPQGIRGFGPIRAARYDNFDLYVQNANNEILVILQIESAEGVKNLDSILRVPGIDVIFIGPNDLAASLGHLGDTNHPKVQQAIALIETATKKAKISLGTVSANMTEAKDLRSRGYQMITLCSDISLLRQGATILLNQFKS